MSAPPVRQLIPASPDSPSNFHASSPRDAATVRSSLSISARSVFLPAQRERECERARAHLCTHAHGRAHGIGAPIRAGFSPAQRARACPRIRTPGQRPGAYDLDCSAFCAVSVLRCACGGSGSTSPALVVGDWKSSTFFPPGEAIPASQALKIAQPSASLKVDGKGKLV